MEDRPTSWMLQAMKRSKEDEERRLLDGFLNRLAIPSTGIEKSECPDFFIQFASEARTVKVGIEIVRFHSQVPRTDASGVEHANRWLRFAERLREALRVNDMGTLCGSIHPKGDARGAFDALNRCPDETIREIIFALRNRDISSHIVAAFDPTSVPLLSAHVDHLYVRRSPPDDRLWWWAPLQSGRVEDPLPILDSIVQEKQRKAQAWTWSNISARWLLIVAEAQSLEDTMSLTGQLADGSVLLTGAPAFTRVFAWDGFFEEIYQLLPTAGRIFSVDAAGKRTLHSRMFPDEVREFCPLLSACRQGNQSLTR